MKQTVVTYIKNKDVPGGVLRVKTPHWMLADRNPPKDRGKRHKRHKKEDKKNA